MKQSKIITLRNILKEYSAYFRYFDYGTCYIPKIYMSKIDNYCANKQKIVKKYNEYLSKPYKKHFAPLFCVYFVNHDIPMFYKKGKVYDESPRNKFLKRYFVITDIDKIIARYRSKLHYEIEKFKSISKANNIPCFEWRLKMFD